MLGALVSLLLPLVLGVAAGRGEWLATESVSSAQAMGALNRFALLVAFPALVVASFLDPSRTLSLAWPVLLLSAAPQLVAVGVALLVGGRRVGRETLPSRGTLALVALFGNSAYLGLPLVDAVLGPAQLALASVIVSVHVALTVMLGTALLDAQGGRRLEPRAVIGKVLKSPLAMSPIVGALAAWALRAGGAEDHPATVAAFHALDVLGKSASPLGIFVLGLFLGGHFLGGQPLGGQPLGAERAGAGAGLVGQLAFALIRLALVPALTLGFALALRASVPIDQDTLRTLVLLSSVPAAISTFAMAEHAKAEPEAVARAIVTTSIASFITIPLWLALTSALA